MDNVLVSVIIPTFNREHFILRAICSAMNQTCKDIEVIVIDDASVDGTYQRLLPYLGGAVRYVRNPSNRGAAFSKNVGIENALGKFISFLDSDDEWDPSKLECEIALLRKSNAVIASSGFVFVDYQTRRVIEKSPNGKKIITKKNYFENPFLTNDFTAYKESVATIGGFCELAWRDDLDLWIRILSVGTGIYEGARLVRKYIGHGDRMSLNHKRKTESTGKIYREYVGDLKVNPKAHGRVLAEFGLLLLDEAFLRSLACFKRAARVAPVGLNKIQFTLVYMLMMILGCRAKYLIKACYCFIHPAYGYIAKRSDIDRKRLPE